MKFKAFFLLVLVGLFGCSKDDDASLMRYELVPVIDVIMPEEFIFGETYQIEITYLKPTSCHVFSGLDVTLVNNERTVGVVNSYNTARSNCTEGNFNENTGLEFIVERDDFYIFKFWKGENEQGVAQFLTIEIPVLSP